MARTSAADLAQALKGADFPLDKEGLKEQALQNGASEEIVQTLDDMPDDEYQSLADVEQAFGESQ